MYVGGWENRRQVITHHYYVLHTRRLQINGAAQILVQNMGWKSD